MFNELIPFICHLTCLSASFPCPPSFPNTSFSHLQCVVGQGGKPDVSSPCLQCTPSHLLHDWHFSSDFGFSGRYEDPLIWLVSPAVIVAGAVTIWTIAICVSSSLSSSPYRKHHQHHSPRRCHSPQSLCLMLPSALFTLVLTHVTDLPALPLFCPTLQCLLL